MTKIGMDTKSRTRAEELLNQGIENPNITIYYSHRENRWMLEVKTIDPETKTNVTVWAEKHPTRADAMERATSEGFRFTKRPEEITLN